MLDCHVETLIAHLSSRKAFCLKVSTNGETLCIHIRSLHILHQDQIMKPLESMRCSRENKYGCKARETGWHHSLTAYNTRKVSYFIVTLNLCVRAKGLCLPWNDETNCGSRRNSYHLKGTKHWTRPQESTNRGTSSALHQFVWRSSTTSPLFRALMNLEKPLNKGGSSLLPKPFSLDKNDSDYWAWQMRDVSSMSYFKTF